MPLNNGAEPHAVFKPKAGYVAFFPGPFHSSLNFRNYE
jgi:hypothetical protein